MKVEDIEIAPSVGSIKPKSALKTTRASDIDPQPIRWLWPQRFALGKLNLVAGDPGLGKSQFTLDMAARVTRGATWPVDGGLLELRHHAHELANHLAGWRVVQEAFRLVTGDEINPHNLEVLITHLLHHQVTSEACSVLYEDHAGAV